MLLLLCCCFVFVCHMVLCFFFFFQAEDGIRDLTVTGVQTCALPIWIERSMIAATSPATRTSLWATRKTPSGVVSSGTVRKNGPLTLEITVGSVVIDSTAARLFSGPTTRATLGTMERPRST